jgi:hypothetical protein
MYLRQSPEHTWHSIDWTNLKFSSYAAYYLSEHAYHYYIESRSDNPEEAMDNYLTLMSSPGFRRFRRESTGNTNTAAALEDIRRALRVLFVKRSIEATPSEDARNVANRAMSTVNRIQATYGRSDNSLLVDLERKLSQERSGDLLQPLYQFWSLYYPSLFPKFRSGSLPVEKAASSTTPLYKQTVSQRK